MKKPYLALSLFIASTAGVAAQSSDYLTFRDAKGSERSLSVDGLKITFEGGTLNATCATGEATFELSQLREMFFTATATGIAAATRDNTKVSIVGGRLRVDAPAGSRIAVFTADGRQVDGRELPRGLYIVKVNDKTHKVIAR